MAYVRRTDTLCFEVLGKVDEMRNKAREPYEAQQITRDTPEYEALRNSVEDVAWKKAPELRGKLPDEWLENCSFDRVELSLPKGDGPHYRVDVRAVDDHTPFKLTPQHSQAGYFRSATVKYEVSDLPPIVSEFFAKNAQREIKYREVSIKYQQIRQQLSDFMQGHASLNKMLETMPEFEHYVPQKYLDKLREPNKKRDTKVEVTIVDDLNIDTNELASLAVGHRIATAHS